MPVRFPRPDLLFVLSLFTLCLSSPISGADSTGALPEKTALDDYMAKEDGSYKWKLVKTVPGEPSAAFLRRYGESAEAGQTFRLV